MLTRAPKILPGNGDAGISRSAILGVKRASITSNRTGPLHFIFAGARCLEHVAEAWAQYLSCLPDRP